MLKMGKGHTDTFFIIPFLNMVSFECNAIYVENVEEFNFQSQKVLKS